MEKSLVATVPGAGAGTNREQAQSSAKNFGDGNKSTWESLHLESKVI